MTVLCTFTLSIERDQISISFYHEDQISISFYHEQLFIIAQQSQDRNCKSTLRQNICQSQSALIGIPWWPRDWELSAVMLCLQLDSWPRNFCMPWAQKPEKKKKKKSSSILPLLNALMSHICLDVLSSSEVGRKTFSNNLSLYPQKLLTYGNS